jgi:hypothetical protein
LLALELVPLLLERLHHFIEFFHLREADGLLAGGQLACEDFEGKFCRGNVREDRDPVIDLGVLDVDRRAEFLFLTHHVVGRHLAEVPREHGVATTLFDFFRSGRLLGRVRIGARERNRELGIEVFFERGCDFGVGLVGSDHVFAFDVVLFDGRGFARLEILLGIFQSSGCARLTRAHALSLNSAGLGAFAFHGN